MRGTSAASGPVLAASSVLVTGASGFVGSAVAALAARAGAPPARSRAPHERTDQSRRARSYRRGRSQGPRLAGGGAEGRALSFPCRCRLSPLGAQIPEEIVRNNVEGTRLLMEEALRAGVERIVYTSSVATLKLVDRGYATEDRSPRREATAIGAYKRSKVAAERLVEAHDPRETGCRPSSSILRRRSARATSSRRRPAASSSKPRADGCPPSSTPASISSMSTTSPRGIWPPCSAAASASATFSAARTCSLADMLADIAAIVGRRPPRLRLPRTALYPVAYAAELVARVTGANRSPRSMACVWSRYYMFFDDCQGAARTRLPIPALPARRWSTRSPGFAPTDDLP